MNYFCPGCRAVAETIQALTHKPDCPEQLLNLHAQAEVRNISRLAAPGLQIVATAPDGEKIKSMIEHKGRILVATESCVYELIGDRLAQVASVPGKIT